MCVCGVPLGVAPWHTKEKNDSLPGRFVARASDRKRSSARAKTSFRADDYLPLVTGQINLENTLRNGVIQLSWLSDLRIALIAD